MAFSRADEEKGRDILDAFHHFNLAPHELMTMPMLATYFNRGGLDLDDMEQGLNYTRLQGGTANGPNQSAILTEEGHAYLLD